MERLKRWLIKIAVSERGQDMVEYAMITIVVSVAIVLVTAGLLSPAFGAWATEVCNEIAPGTCA